MSRRASALPGEVGVEEWSGRRLLAVGFVVVVTAAALLGGLGYAVYLSLAPPSSRALAREASVVGPAAESASGAAEEQAQRRDAIASEPMLPVGSQAAMPAPPSTQSAPGITIPPATGSGPGGVPTGFPRTPEGAVAQLAAIETSVFQAMSIPLTAGIHQHWTLPQRPHSDSEDGGEGVPSDGAASEAGVIDLDLDDSTGSGRRDLASGDLGRGRFSQGESDAPDTGVAGWEIARHVQSFLGAAQMGPEKDVTTTVTATPAAGLVKGSDGPDWVLACVLLEVRAVITTEARIGFGHCERMQWHDGRWLIAPGTPPARAPSTWPGTQQSLDAGWRTWVDTDPTLDETPPDDGGTGEG
ncbi:hypothetical protein [Aquipuribacter sp. MA13-6]|uniref:hypothetical protein n=1 Tax=unclassified Aquipuribacter TaxID=2635084 RepID=UPI003EEE6869